jgi:GIY-YIG catalytic domain
MARPKRSQLPSPQVQEFRQALDAALNEVDEEGRAIGNSQFGVYAFYDFDGEPIYVGQTNRKLRDRVRRHLTNQRTDAVAMRVLDIFEVAEIELWPLWELEGQDKKSAKPRLNQVEYAVYVHAVEASRFKAILNEKIPKPTAPTDLPPSRRMRLVERRPEDERWHADVRLGRRAETISRLAAVVRERGEVSDGLRRVLVVQAVRLTHLAAARYAKSQGAPAPDHAAIDVGALVGELLAEHPGSMDEREIEQEELGDGDAPEP